MCVGDLVELLAWACGQPSTQGCTYHRRPDTGPPRHAERQSVRCACLSGGFGGDWMLVAFRCRRSAPGVQRPAVACRRCRRALGLIQLSMGASHTDLACCARRLTWGVGLLDVCTPSHPRTTWAAVPCVAHQGSLTRTESGHSCAPLLLMLILLLLPWGRPNTSVDSACLAPTTPHIPFSPTAEAAVLVMHLHTRQR